MPLVIPLSDIYNKTVSQSSAAATGQSNYLADMEKTPERDLFAKPSLPPAPVVSARTHHHTLDIQSSFHSKAVCKSRDVDHLSQLDKTIFLCCEGQQNRYTVVLLVLIRSDHHER